MIDFPILLFSINEIFPKTKYWVWAIVFFIMFLILIFLIKLIFKEIIKSGYILIPLFILNILLFFYYYTKSKNFFNETEKELISYGYSFDLEKVFPLKNSKAQCQEWLEKTKVLTIKMEKFYSKNLKYFLSNEYFTDLFKNNIEESKLNEFFEINNDIILAFQKCPYIQLTNVEEYINKLSAQNIDIYPIIKWVKFLFSSSQIFLLNGDVERAKEIAKQLNYFYEKIDIKGQNATFLIITRFSKQLIILKNAAYLKIYKKPLEIVDEEITKNFANDDLSSTLNTFFIDFLPLYNYIKKLKMLENENFSKFEKQTLKFFLPALGYGFSKYYMNFWLERLKLKKEVNTAESKFAWEKYRKLPQKGSLFFPNIHNIYAKALLSIAQARTLYISNEVFKYFEKNKKLPENLKFLEGNLKIDPFTEKEFIYKKEGEKRFKVYSIGDDGEDNKGENLYFIGPSKINKKINQDIGFTFDL